MELPSVFFHNLRFLMHSHLTFFIIEHIVRSFLIPNLNADGFWSKIPPRKTKTQIVAKFGQICFESLYIPVAMTWFSKRYFRTNPKEQGLVSTSDVEAVFFSACLVLISSNKPLSVNSVVFVFVFEPSLQTKKKKNQTQTWTSTKKSKYLLQ